VSHSSTLPSPSIAAGTVPVIELTGHRQARLAERQTPATGPLLRVETAGVCGTDRHIFDGRLPVALPRALGHEVVGRLERVCDADGITLDGPLEDGVRVVLAPGVPCGECEGCRAQGRCGNRRVYGIDMPGEGLTGGFSPLLSLRPGTHLFQIPEELDFERAVFAETMACVLSGLRKAVGPDRDLADMRSLVLGFGSIGVCAATAVAERHARVAILEHDPRRRDLAREMGFTDVHQTVAAMQQASQVGRREFDLVIDAAGTPRAFAAGVGELDRGGTLLELGNFADFGRAKVSPSAICCRDLRIVGSGETLYEDFSAAVRLVSQTSVELERAVTDVYPFATLEDPNALLADHPTGKAVITFP
jgi:threonine dehydrogenase-like Zn-dependent dehydrogenase